MTDKTVSACPKCGKEIIKKWIAPKKADVISHYPTFPLIDKCENCGYGIGWDERLTKKQYDILSKMDSDYSYGFNHFINESMDRKTVKKTMHELRDLGLVEFSRGLINDDGQSCGSGYGIKDWYVVQKLLEKYMTTKVKPTVDQWDEERKISIRILNIFQDYIRSDKTAEYFLPQVDIILKGYLQKAQRVGYQRCLTKLCESAKSAGLSSELVDIIFPLNIVSVKQKNK